MLKKIIMFLLLVTSSCGSNDPLLKNSKDIDEIKKVNMLNLEDKMNYLIHKLEIGKKYYFEEQKTFLEFIIIGTWGNPPTGLYLFENNHQYKMLDKYNTTVDKIVIGKWNFTSDGLELYLNGKNKKVKIEHFRLSKDDEENRYYFAIAFEKGDLLLTIDTADSKLWEKEPPIK